MARNAENENQGLQKAKIKTKNSHEDTKKSKATAFQPPRTQRAQRLKEKQIKSFQPNFQRAKVKDTMKSKAKAFTKYSTSESQDQKGTQRF